MCGTERTRKGGAGAVGENAIATEIEGRSWRGGGELAW